ncbi:unnamed protein product [Closterium sp. Naga37s-1]|nr:unnamed protein product [Closterium sp. Naga37s-1]
MMATLLYAPSACHLRASLNGHSHPPLLFSPCQVHQKPSQEDGTVPGSYPPSHPFLSSPPPLPLPLLRHRFIGNLLKGQTVGIIGAGRIARMMVEGFKMNLIYYDLYQSKRLEESVTAYSRFLQSQGEPPVTWRRASSPEEVLQVANVVSLDPVLDKTTFHLLDESRLNMMKKVAILVNCSRGPVVDEVALVLRVGAVVDEVALVKHLKANPAFRAALDVFEDEPLMKPGLPTLPNVVVVPHIASASQWTRAGCTGSSQRRCE